MNKTLTPTSIPPAAENIQSLAERCVAHVKQRFGIELDYTEDTLSVLDHFIEAVVKEEGGGTPPPAGHKRRAHLVQLLAPTIGAYFGEVLRRSFVCRWDTSSEEPYQWSIEFEQVLLRLKPVGSAAEALMADRIEEWDGAIATSTRESEALAERLKVAPPVPENEFFALATRHEVLQIAEDYLSERKSKSKIAQPALYTRAHYIQQFEEN